MTFASADSFETTCPPKGPQKLVVVSPADDSTVNPYSATIVPACDDCFEAQIKAIIARDQHCTGCAADPQRCEIHHIVPWEQGGLTDIDKMCLACPMCHHNIRDRGYFVMKTNTGYTIINPNKPPYGP